PTIKMLALGMAVAVFIDASIVRMILVPSVMSLLGEHAWWMPHWMERFVPQLQIEGPSEEKLAAADAAAGHPVAASASVAATPSPPASTAAGPPASPPPPRSTPGGPGGSSAELSATNLISREFAGRPAAETSTVAARQVRRSHSHLPRPPSAVDRGGRSPFPP